MDESEYGRPSSWPAVSKSPPATARRTRVDETGRPPIWTWSTTSTEKPSSPPSRSSRATSPVLPRPKPWSYPITNSRMSKRSSSSRTNASGVKWDSSAVKFRNTTTSSSHCARNSRRSSASVSSEGAACGLTISRGCGSNVTSRLRRPARRALSAISSSTWRCPRCTPSKVPTVTTLPWPSLGSARPGIIPPAPRAA